MQVAVAVVRVILLLLLVLVVQEAQAVVVEVEQHLHLKVGLLTQVVAVVEAQEIIPLLDIHQAQAAPVSSS
jgi:hypothetical protein